MHLAKTCADEDAYLAVLFYIHCGASADAKRPTSLAVVFVLTSAARVAGMSQTIPMQSAYCGLILVLAPTLL